MNKKDFEALENIATFFRAFSEPTRLAILQLLKENKYSVNELAKQLDTSQANISKHIIVQKKPSPSLVV